MSSASSIPTQYNKGHSVPHHTLHAYFSAVDNTIFKIFFITLRHYVYK